MLDMIRTLLGRPWIFNIAVVGAVLAVIYLGAELVVYWAEGDKNDLRREKSASAGKWIVEEGVSKRFGGRPFVMASANSALVGGDHFYDLSLICYGPSEAGASLLILLYKVAITSKGLGAYPFGAGEWAEYARQRLAERTA